MSKYHRSSTDYSGRTNDILLLQYVTDPVADAIVRPDVSKLPRMTTGIEKLVQRFAILFLTQAGTVKNRDEEGTAFMGLLGTGKIYDTTSLNNAAAAANKEVFRQIRMEDAALETPDDEALASSEVISVSVNRSTASVSVTIKIITVAGDSYTYITPLPVGA